jgi:3-deoxy-D-manno-octulosonic-acid transferase
LPLLPALGAYTLWRRYRQGKSAASVAGLWGHVPPEVEAALGSSQNGTSDSEASTRETPRIWIHAVSVGETMAARPVARALRDAIPDCRIALSCTTDTGHETAQAALRSGEVDATFFFPLDVPLAVKRTLRAVRPHAFLLMETELWPNVLHLARRQGARTFLVNGRVSDNLLDRAPKLGRLWRWMMANLDGLLMRSQFDARRMLQLGALKSRVVVTGDVKLDALPMWNKTSRCAPSGGKLCKSRRMPHCGWPVPRIPVKRKWCSPLTPHCDKKWQACVWCWRRATSSVLMKSSNWRSDTV